MLCLSNAFVFLKGRKLYWPHALYLVRTVNWPRTHDGSLVEFAPPPETPDNEKETDGKPEKSGVGRRATKRKQEVVRPSPVNEGNEEESGEEEDQDEKAKSSPEAGTSTKYVLLFFMLYI